MGDALGEGAPGADPEEAELVQLVQQLRRSCDILAQAKCQQQLDSMRSSCRQQPLSVDVASIVAGEVSELTDMQEVKRCQVKARWASLASRTTLRLGQLLWGVLPGRSWGFLQVAGCLARLINWRTFDGARQRVRPANWIRADLESSAMLRFATLNGFEGTPAEWGEEYEGLCEEWKMEPSRGFTEDVFARLVNDESERGCYCTDRDLQA
ncbi:unnamed protein product, partial [Prorocentrum cordatum]